VRFGISWIRLTAFWAPGLPPRNGCPCRATSSAGSPRQRQSSTKLTRRGCGDFCRAKHHVRGRRLRARRATRAQVRSSCFGRHRGRTVAPRSNHPTTAWSRKRLPTRAAALHRRPKCRHVLRCLQRADDALLARRLAAFPTSRTEQVSGIGKGRLRVNHCLPGLLTPHLLLSAKPPKIARTRTYAAPLQPISLSRPKPGRAVLSWRSRTADGLRRDTTSTPPTPRIGRGRCDPAMAWRS
jgi:hypothetical protein